MLLLRFSSDRFFNIFFLQEQDCHDFLLSRLLSPDEQRQLRHAALGVPSSICN